MCECVLPKVAIAETVVVVVVVVAHAAATILLMLSSPQRSPEKVNEESKRENEAVHSE